MRNKQKAKGRINMIIAFMLLVVLVIGGRAMLPAFADTLSYTSALEDLQKDASFDVNDYPDKPKDYSIQVIQIAESTDGELFVYTYQPSQNTTRVTATEINMSLSEDFDISIIPDNTDENENQGSGGSVKPIPKSGTAVTKLYELTLIDTSGVFGKYKVNGFTVSSDPIRYYNITSIYRAYIKGIDGSTGGITVVSNDNTVNAVSYTVGKCWKVTTVAGSVKYEMKEVETVKVTEKHVGFIRYRNGFKLVEKSCDSHYIAFSTDKQIDYLLEADVSFVYRGCIITYSFGSVSDRQYGEPMPKQVTITCDDLVNGYTGGWFSKEYNFERIERAEDFVSKEELEPAEKSKIENKEWVLRFFETPYEGATTPVPVAGRERFYEVSEETILRLKYITDGVTYNLGVVDNKQTGSGKPSNPTDGNFNFWAYVWNCIINLFTGQASVGETIVAVMALIVALIVVAIVIALFKWLYRLIFK